MESLSQEIEKISVSSSNQLLSNNSNVHVEEYPESYTSNNKKEKLILSYCENFQRQFIHLYPDRKPLLLCPPNECGIDKSIMSRVVPTRLPYKELYDYDMCAQFLADYLTFEALDPSIDTPASVASSSTVLKCQQGTCFDLSILLCSLLIGVGYDAYCVSGYATKETTLVDESRDTCPLLKQQTQVSEDKEEKRAPKYQVRPPKDLSSKFEAKMAAKAVSQQLERERKIQEEDAQKLQDRYKAKHDQLHGLRVHCWVVILAGKREVPEAFYIEALTGHSKSIDFAGYLGVEFLWNHRNFWVNMQDCSQGVKNLSFDLGDAVKWEFVFPNNDHSLLALPHPEDDPLDLDADEDNESDKISIDQPPSWVEKISVTKEQFNNRCPGGKKTILYKEAKLEKFADYLCNDGLSRRLSIYNDIELKELRETREYYKNRADLLSSRIHQMDNGLLRDCFHPGRSKSLKEHSYYLISPGPESDRTMLFYDRSREDGLTTRIETSLSMNETFVGREDHLINRFVEFGKRVKKFGPQDGNKRPIARITEEFSRDRSKKADADVAYRVFHIGEDRITISYHVDDGRITASKREFIKPPNCVVDKSVPIHFTSDMTTAFQVDQEAKPMKNLEVYELFMHLLEDEKKSVDTVRDSEEEVRDILDERIKDESISELLVSVYDTERNEKTKQRRLELERREREEELRQRDLELDDLAPFLARIGNPDKLTSREALQVKEECLADLKQRLIDKANLIQARFEYETNELQNKQAWYQQHQMSVTKDDEGEYLEFCSDAMFRIHILELRLNRHKETAPIRYRRLDEKLRKDARLCDYV